MAFADYIDLRTAVIEEVGAPEIADRFDRLTKLAEAALNRVLRTRYQITTSALTIASGVASLPSDFTEAIGLFDAQGRELLARPHQLTAQTYQRGQYSVTGTQIKGADGTYSLQYYAKLPTLTASLTTSNWLLENFPSIYLYAVSVEALKHLRRIDEVSAVASVLAGEMASVATDDFAARYARGGVRVQGGTP
jgi:hypothetical protein